MAIMFPSARVAAPFALLLAALLPTVSVASTPASGTTRGCSGAGANPGVYNLEINGYPAKIFNDIVLQLPIDTGFFVEDPAVITRALHRRHVDELILNNLILYIDMDGEGVLFDGGFGPSETPFGSGRLFELLAGEGISMESIKHILVTHGHVDHIAGLVEGLDSFKPAFTEATIHMSRLEYEWWTSDPVDNGTTLLSPEFIEGNVFSAKSILAAVDSQLKLFEMDEEPLPGITAIHIPWHTRGSVAYAIKDGNSTLVHSGLMWVDHQGVNFQATADAYVASPTAASVCA